MEALKFNLSGKTAFFKKPDVNTYLYFSYGNIHKIAILGILGAAIGLKGYSSQNGEKYPEFYEKLSKLKIAIIPENEKGYIPKKVQIFNNSVGYASKEKGGNLIVKEQWLENPKWIIYILLDDNPYYNIIKQHFLNYSFTYIPYLGKNDHFANITEVEVIKLDKVDVSNKINSLYLKKHFEVSSSDMDINADDEEWKYEERLPVDLEEVTNQYITDTFVFTNMNVEAKDEYPLYRDADKILFFF